MNRTIEPPRENETSGATKILLLVVTMGLYAYGFKYLLTGMFLALPILYCERKLNMTGPLTWLLSRRD